MLLEDATTRRLREVDGVPDTVADAAEALFGCCCGCLLWLDGGRWWCEDAEGAWCAAAAVAEEASACCCWFCPSSAVRVVAFIVIIAYFRSSLSLSVITLLVVRWLQRGRSLFAFPIHKQRKDCFA